FLQVPSRSLVSGTFSIDYAAATLSQGTLGLSFPWLRGNNVGTPAVLSYSLTIGGFDYSPASAINSTVQGTFSGNFSLSATTEFGSGERVFFDMSFKPAEPTVAAFLSNGLPNLDAIDFSQSQGSLSTIHDGEVGFFLTSLSPESVIPPGGM